MAGYLTIVKRQWPLLVFGFCTVFWGNFGQSFFLSWYGAAIQRALDLSASRYGLIYASATLASGLSIMLLGGLLDRWRLRLFITVTATILMLASVSMAFIDSVTGLAASFFLLRLTGQGLLPLTGQTTMARAFDVGRGKAISIALSGIPAGEMILPTLTVILIAQVGWRESWLVFAGTIPALYLPLSFWLLHKSAARINSEPHLSAAPNLAKSGRREVLMDWRFWLILPAVLANPFMLTGIFIQQDFILQQKGWSPAWLAGSFVAYGVMHWLISILSGLLIDQFRAQRLLPYIMMPLLLSLLALAALEGKWVAPLFLTLLGCAIGMANSIISAVWAETYDLAKQGSIRSMMAALMILSSSLSPWLFGVLIDNGITASVLFSGAAIAVFLAGLLVLPAYPFTVRTNAKSAK